ncbi:MAG: 2-hydroxychromene-2-carboxylate isomerase [Parvibaculaceae bacterium]|nr:2-hydroxychromene-2-carboxylate isomerase [Parvibaculaceae bacterium]
MNIRFLFDFGSPNAYLSHRVLPQLAARTGVTVDYVPVLLGGIFKATNNQSPAMAFAGIRNKLEYDHLEMERFIRRHGLTKFVFNPFFPVNTLQIMRGAAAADLDGFLPAYVEAVMTAMWENGKKMDDPEVIVAALDAAGLDGAAILARTQAPEVKAHLLANTEKAVESGAFGIPTFFVGPEIFFGKDRLRDVEEEIVRVQKAG